MKRLLSNSTLILLVVFTLFSCGKEPLISEWSQLSADECGPFQYDEPVVVVDFGTSGIQYQFPCFNPDNSDEIAYVKLNGNQCSLVKYNMSSKQETVLIANTFISSQPVWTRSGWIFYTVAPANIVYKVSENGGSITQITQAGWEAINFGVDKVTDNVLIHSNGSNMGNPDYHGIYNVDGVKVDSLRWRFEDIYVGGHCQALDLHHSGYKTYGDVSTPQPAVGICQIWDNNVSFIQSFDNALTGPITVAQNDQYFFYVMYWGGFYRFNKQTLETVRLEDLCTARNIRAMSISDDGRYLLLERVTATKEGGQGVYLIDEQSDIYLYHIQLGGQKKVLAEQ